MANTKSTKRTTTKKRAASIRQRTTGHTGLPWSFAELHRSGAIRTYRGQQLNMIAVPIGGIGTGCLSLGGWGQLQDWEIYGKPGKGNLNEMAFFSLYAHPRGGAPVAKVLQGPSGGPRMGPPNHRRYSSGGSGMWGRAHGAGLPHFRGCELAVHYPFTEFSLRDTVMPLQAKLVAWNPFIPLEEDDSSIPCAIFQWQITNPTDRRVDAVLFMNLTNTIGFPDVGSGLNSYRHEEGAGGIFFTSTKHTEGSLRAGTMALATSHRELTHLVHWKRGGWFDSLTDFWAQARTGTLDETVASDASAAQRGDTGSIGLRFSLGPGAARTLPLVVTWHFPLQEQYWATPDAEGRRPALKPWYATRWCDAWEVARYVLGNLKRLERDTRLYDETLRATTMPGHIIEAVAATSSILKSPTCLRLTGGELWAWEGCHDDAGSCEGTCTHVWNYQQTLPYLFPHLERGIRETDYAFNLHDDGHMSFRMPLPLGTRGSTTCHAAADGQLGGILKVYREWRISGDRAWLDRLWPSVQRAMRYAWIAWDRDRDGIMEAPQHNTYDIEFWGPNTMCGTFYLGALRAAEEMARYLGDSDFADTCRSVYQRGRAAADAQLWNGEYYEQKIDPKAGIGDLLIRPAESHGKAVDEEGRPKYQYGTGCLSDQLIGQLFADMLELGDLLDADHIRSALRSIFRYNWKSDLFDHANPQRIYAQDEEAGLLLCSWPRGAAERFPFPYSDEVWTGVEYAVAAQLSYRGMIEEALAIVKAVRQRYDGARRNPYDEFECGHHYARAMASYAVLLALSGFAVDMPNRRFAFRPRLGDRDFRCFYSVETGWGLISRENTGSYGDRYRVDVAYGRVELARLSVNAPVAKAGSRLHVRATIGGKQVAAAAECITHGVEISLSQVVNVKPGMPLVLTLRQLRE